MPSAHKNTNTTLIPNGPASENYNGIYTANLFDHPFVDSRTPAIKGRLLRREVLKPHPL